MKGEFGLWDAEDVARRFKMSPEELLDLAESGYVPHYRLMRMAFATQNTLADGEGGPVERPVNKRAQRSRKSS